LLGRSSAGCPTRVSVAVFLLFLLALVLGFFRLGAKSIWLDESASIDHAHSDLESLVRVLGGRDPNMGLYYVALRVWVAAFGESEFAVRSLSVLFAALAVPALYFVGARLFGRAAAAAAALLLAIDEFFIKYAQEARSYSLVVLLVTLSSYFFVVELERPSKRTRAAYVLTSALAVYAHYFALYVLLVQLLTAVALRRGAALNRQWLTAGAAIVLLCAPEAAAGARKGTGGINWISQPNVHTLARALLDLAGGSRAVLVVFLLGGCYAATLAAREGERWRFGFAGAWLVVPILLSFAVSFARPMFISYYLIVSLPALVLVAAAGLTRVPGHLFATVLMIGLVSLSAFQLAAWYKQQGSEDWRGATEYILAAARPGDGIVFYPSYARKPFDYYERRQGQAGPERLDRYGQLKALRENPRIWLVLRGSDVRGGRSELRKIKLAVARNYRLAGRHPFQGVGIDLYRLRRVTR
jgi:mannosyltransferase